MLQTRSSASSANQSPLPFHSAVFTSLVKVITYTLTSRFYQNAYDSPPDIYSDNNSVTFVARLAFGAEALEGLFNIIAELMVFLTLASLIRCIRLAHSRDDNDKHPRRHKWSRYLAYAVSFLITLLALTSFSIALYSVVLSGITSSTTGIVWDRSDEYEAVGRLIDVFYRALLFFICVSVLVRASVLRRKLRHAKHLRKSLTYLIVCNVLWFIRAGFDIYLITTGAAAESFSFDLNATSSLFEILMIVLTTWPIFIAFVILYYLGLDTKMGLWSSDRPLLSVNMESPAESSECLQSDAQTNTPVVETPMAERANIPILTAAAPTAGRPESLFAWEGLNDAPPEYSPPAAQPGITSTAPAEPMAPIPISRRPLPSSATPLVTSGTSPRARQSEESSLTRTESAPAAARPVTTRHSIEQTPPRLSQDQIGTQEHTMAVVSDLPEHEEVMGLYHQADGRVPESESSSSLPSHDETIGLYHQADGRPPGDSANVVPSDSSARLFQPADSSPEMNNEPPAHDEAMGLNHQADGRMPESEVTASAYPDEKKKK